MRVSVLIPSLNEEALVARAVGSAFAAGAAEVIVCDGGSSDGTAAVAAAAGALVMNGETMRARQLNAGARSATGDALLFLHADSVLPDGAADAVRRALGGGARFGGFRLAFSEPDRSLRIAEAMINLRTSITRCPWGDQAQFLRRDDFLEGGGFREIPIMEDYELAVRMKRRGPTAVVPLTVRTSGRRFLEKGLLRTAAVNWRIVAAYRFGVDPDVLARWYRGDHFLLFLAGAFAGAVSASFFA